jgi:hypothetical protein
MKRLASALILIAGFMINSHVFAQQFSIKLFDVRPTFGTGPVKSPAEAEPFAGRFLIFSFAPQDTAVVSSTPDGTGPIVIDNFMTINGVNVCEGVPSQLAPESCFGPFIQDPANPGVIGMPIDTVLTPIPSIDVTSLLTSIGTCPGCPDGTTGVTFELRDFGGIAGNTDLFLVIKRPSPDPEH